jgi:hypothetical protein
LTFCRSRSEAIVVSRDFTEMGVPLYWYVLERVSPVVMSLLLVSRIPVTRSKELARNARSHQPLQYSEAATIIGGFGAGESGESVIYERTDLIRRLR